MTNNIIPMSTNQSIITTVKTHLEVTCDPAFDEAWINGVRYVPAPDRPAVTPAVDARGPGSVTVATPGEEYDDDLGPVTWWRFPVDEPPWVGTPNDSDWPGYHTHFTPQPPVPQVPAAAAPDRPLWELMRDAFAAGLGGGVGGGMAAELRCVADWLVERHHSDPVVHTAWEAAQWLRAEAERAEAAE